MCINSRKLTAMGPSHSFQDPFSCVFSPYIHTHTHTHTHTNIHIEKRHTTVHLALLPPISCVSHEQKSLRPPNSHQSLSAAAPRPHTLCHPLLHTHAQTRTHRHACTREHTHPAIVCAACPKHKAGTTHNSRRARMRSHSSAPTKSLPHTQPPLPCNTWRGGSTARRLPKFQRCRRLTPQGAGGTTERAAAITSFSIVS